MSTHNRPGASNTGQHNKLAVRGICALNEGLGQSLFVHRPAQGLKELGISLLLLSGKGPIPVACACSSNR